MAASVPDPTPLPRGRHGLAREEVELSQRSRLLDAVLVVVAERGYAAASVSRIVTQARVSREVFYSLFASKDACWTESAAAVLARREAAFLAGLAATPDAPPHARARRAVDAYLGAVAAGGTASRALGLELTPLGRGVPEAVLRSRAVLAAALVDTLDLADPFPARAFVAMVDAVVEETIASGDPADVGGLVKPLGRALDALTG